METSRKRELATVNIRIYPSTREMLSRLSDDAGQSMARVVDRLVKELGEDLEMPNWND